MEEQEVKQTENDNILNEITLKILEFINTKEIKEVEQLTYLSDEEITKLKEELNNPNCTNKDEIRKKINQNNIIILSDKGNVILAEDYPWLLDYSAIYLFSDSIKGIYIINKNEIEYIDNVITITNVVKLKQ